MGPYETLWKRCASLWDVTERYRALQDVTVRYRSVADRYGALTERKGTVKENIDFAHQ